uniref:Small-subunit processome Utp12 domain-containing protein n=1 Tax=Photinus pyralis TaxID=7054 RepID=A0A1Y1KTT8_PHOPY
MATQFSKDGKHFARLSTNGKLKLWETSTSSFLQEFTPDFHLTSPCTCLHFVQRDSSENHVPRKKKRKDSTSTSLPAIALGTSTGKLLVYSISKGDLDYTIDSETSLPIKCMSWCDGAILYSAIDQNIVKWNLEKRWVKSKWKVGNEIITSILALPYNKVMVGAKMLKLCDASTQEVLRTFTGHTHDVVFLNYLSPSSGGDTYVISGSSGDRLLTVWNVSEGSEEKTGVANFLMDDVPAYVSTLCSEGSSNVVAVTQGGVAHFYKHTLNGKCSKPLKPRTKIQVASHLIQKQTVSLIPIVGARLNDDLSLLLGYGNEVLLTFENIDISDNEKLQTLVREDRNLTKVGHNAIAKTQTPLVDNVHYLTPHASGTFKRKSDGRQEVPMEIRLENLTLNKLDSKSKTPRVNNVAQLLVQGLHSKNKTILASVLNGNHDESVIKNTIKRLPVPVLLPLVQELTALIQGTTVPSQYGSVWLKHLLEVHAGIFLSNPDLPNMLGPVLGSIESRLSLLTPLNRLKGRLDLLVSQVANVTAAEEDKEEDALLVYNDKGLSDSESEIMDVAPQSESENEWNEDSEVGESNAEESDNDIEML